MTGLIECVPNFSEGRRDDVIETLREEIVSTRGASLLNIHADRSHHRSVFTFVGEAEAVGDAAFRAVRAASRLIDLRHHHGEHPRIGAADVVPFVPLRDATLADCAAVARQVGRRIGDELDIPVFFYGPGFGDATRDLPAIRRGGLAGLRDRMERDAATCRPDVGPRQLHPTAGATAVGARGVLVAFNVFLECDSAEPATRIARAIRTSGGGLPAVRALGFLVAGRGQVSMNLLDIDTTTPLIALEAVRLHAERLGIEVSGSEFVGMVPERALPADPRRTLLLKHDVADRILEPRMRELEEREQE